MMKTFEVFCGSFVLFLATIGTSDKQHQRITMPQKCFGVALFHRFVVFLVGFNGT